MNADSLRLWNAAVKAFDDKDLEICLELFQAMPNPTAFVLYNSAVVLCMLGVYEEAVQKLTEAIEKNGHMAIIFYRRGSVYFLQKRYEEAIEDFESCGRLFKSSNHIDYMQLGLASKLFLSDVYINTGLCYLSNGNLVKGVELLLKARDDPSGRNVSVIEKIFSELEQSKADFSATLIQLSSVAPLFRPLKNVSEKPIDFLGRSKIIASKDHGSSSHELSEVQSNETHIDSKNGADSARGSADSARDSADSARDSADSARASTSTIPPPPANPPPRKPCDQTSGQPPSEDHLHPLTQPEVPPPRSPRTGVKTYKHVETRDNGI